MVKNIYKDLDDFLIYANEGNVSSEQLVSNFTIRKGALIHFRKQAEFKQYVEKLYCDLKIKDSIDNNCVDIFESTYKNLIR